MRDLLLKAVSNLEFREEFLKDPVGVGRKNGVTFTGEQLEKIKMTTAFVESLKEFRLPKGPIFYPIDPILYRIRIEEIIHVLKYFVFYPVDIGRIREGILRERFRIR